MDNDGNMTQQARQINPAMLQSLIKSTQEQTATGGFVRVQDDIGWVIRQLNNPAVNKMLNRLYAKTDELKFKPLAAAEQLLSISQAFDLTVADVNAHVRNIYAILPLLEAKLTSPAFLTNLKQCQLAAIDFDQLNALLAKGIELNHKSPDEQQCLAETKLLLSVMVKRISDYLMTLDNVKKQFLPICEQDSANALLAQKLVNTISGMVREANERKRLADCAREFHQAAYKVGEEKYKAVVPGYLTVRGGTITDQIKFCVLMAEKCHAYATNFSLEEFSGAEFYVDTFNAAVADCPQWNSNLITKFARNADRKCREQIYPDIQGIDLATSLAEQLLLNTDPTAAAASN